MAVIDEAMGRQLFYNFVKFDFISIIMFIKMLRYSWWYFINHPIYLLFKLFVHFNIQAF